MAQWLWLIEGEKGNNMKKQPGRSQSFEFMSRENNKEKKYKLPNVSAEIISLGLP